MWRLIIFLLTFTAIYGVLHFYAFMKARKAFCLGPAGSVPLALFMAFMLFAPIIVRVLDRSGYEAVPRVLAFAGYVWMGFLFLFICASLLLDVLNILTRAGAFAVGAKSVRGMVPPRMVFFLALLCAAAVTGYGYFQALDIRTRHITISSPKIPMDVGRFRLAQISDVHLGIMVGKARLRRILDQVKAAEPDLFVATGDLVDGQMDDIDGLVTLFRDITPRYGKFAVTGNHEFYVGVERAVAFMTQAGFRVLRDEGLNITAFLAIAGVDDPGRGRQGRQSGITESEVLAGLPQQAFILFLKHRPELDKKSLGHFDLQLSGHTHGGQIFPFSLISKIFYPIGAGLHLLEGPSYLYVSRGSGTWGPPLRFLAPPEVTVIDIVHGKGVVE